MPDYAAFLRGINLGASRRVSGEQLAAAFTDAGLEEPVAFLTSGNVAFRAGRAPAADLAARAEAGLAERLGFDVRVIVRTAAQVRAIAAAEPFAAEELARTEGRLQVMLLGDRPSAAAKEAVAEAATDEDALALEGRELYWLPRAGTQTSSLDVRELERRLGLTTMRTKNTLERMAAKFFPA